MAVHRYWRFRIPTGVGSGHYVQEVAFYDQEASFVHVAGATLTGSGFFSIASISDGNVGSPAYTSSGINNAWVLFDYGASPKDIIRVGVFCGGNSNISSFVVEWSDDNVNWTTLIAPSGIVNNGLWQYFGVSDPNFVVAQVRRDVVLRDDPNVQLGRISRDVVLRTNPTLKVGQANVRVIRDGTPNLAVAQLLVRVIRSVETKPDRKAYPVVNIFGTAYHSLPPAP